MLFLPSILKAAVFLLATSATAIPVSRAGVKTGDGLALRGEVNDIAIAEHTIPPALEDRAHSKKKGSSQSNEDLTIPSVSDFLKGKMVVPAGASLFWAGPGDYNKQAKKAISSRPKLARYLRVVDMLQDKAQATAWSSTERKDSHPAKYNAFWVNASEAMARASSGVVYVLLPKGQDTPATWYKHTFWNKYEFPLLKKNGKVTKLIAIHPGDNVEVDLTHCLDE